MKSKFFDKRTSQSEVKSTIVTKYFKAWAQVMVGVQGKHSRADKRIAYIDLYAGPGKYADETPSTPLLILQEAIQDSKIRERLVTLFNDKNERNASLLQKAINQLPHVNTLKYFPDVLNREVDDEEFSSIFEKMKLIPTLIFIDPWGYKGLSLRLIKSVIKDWGCDCIFFFNYRRINMGLANLVVKGHMDALFGESRAEELRNQIDGFHSTQRESIIIEALHQALRNRVAEYVQHFGFKDNNGKRTTHHLVFVSKNFLGYDIMKEIMANESSNNNNGIATFEYGPTVRQLPLLNELSTLGDMILEEFAGKSITMEEIYKKHSVHRPYIKKNYKDILTKLERQGKIETSTHRRGSFGDKVIVTFPNH